MALIARTFSQLSTAVKQLGAWENSDDITPEVLLQAINYALIEGYDTMVARWADYYTVNNVSAVTSGQDTYSLSGLTMASDFYKLRHIDFSFDGTRYQRMYPFDLETQYQYSSTASNAVRAPRYRIQGPNLILAPPRSGSINVYYIPQPFQFDNIADLNEAIFDAPTEERLVVHLAMRDLLVRSDLSTSSVDGMIERLSAQLKTAGDNRDAGEAFSLIDNPRRYGDVDGWFDGWD